MSLSTIQPKTWWLRFAAMVGLLAECRWITIAPHVYAASAYWAQPGPHWLPLVAHEFVHLSRQKSLGFWTWCWRYYTDPDFRLFEEAIAIAEEIEETQSTERKLFLIEDYSRQLAGREYFRCAPSPGVARMAIAHFLGKPRDESGHSMVTAREIQG